MNGLLDMLLEGAMVTARPCCVSVKEQSGSIQFARHHSEVKFSTVTIPRRRRNTYWIHYSRIDAEQPAAAMHRLFRPI